MSASLFAHAADDRFSVTAIGRELRVHAPLQTPDHRTRLALGAPAVALAAAGPGVVCLDAGQTLTWWDPLAGQRVNQMQLGFTGSDVTVADDGRVAVTRVGEGVSLVYAGAQPFHLQVPKASTSCVSPDGQRVAVGTGSGEVILFDPRGNQLGVLDAEAPVQCITYNPLGFFLIGAGERLARFSRDGKEAAHVTRGPDMKPDHLSCSADGSVLGIGFSHDLAIAMSFPERETLGQLIYPEKVVVGTGASRALFAVGLDAGDINWLHFGEKQLYRQDPHPGQTRNRWLVNVSV